MYDDYSSSMRLTMCIRYVSIVRRLEQALVHKTTGIAIKVIARSSLFLKDSYALSFSNPSLVLPQVLHIRLCQPFIRPEHLLPSHEPSIQDKHLLLLLSLPGTDSVQHLILLPYVLERCAWSALLAERAVEDDGVLVGELTDESGHLRV